MSYNDKRGSWILDRELLVFYLVNVSLILLLFLVVGMVSSGVSGSTGSTVLPSNIISTNFIYLGFLALLFGLRHAVDADHIAAIDTSTRKLMGESKSSKFTGLYFSLGHSTIVIALSVLLMLSTRYIIKQLPSLEIVGSVIGPMISAIFLLIMAIINVSILVSLRRLFRKHHASAELDLNELMAGAGLLNRLFRGLFASVKTQRYLYPIGLLFGLGFDTASEVLILSVSAVLAGVFLSVPIWWLLIFPALFTLGMTLVDTTDGYTMNRAYGWASGDPAKKIWYNITLTALSVIFAVTAAIFELASVLATNYNLSGFPWLFFTGVTNLYWEILGGIIVLSFVVIFTISYVRYRRSISAASAE